MTKRGIFLIVAASRFAIILSLLFGCAGKSGAEPPQVQAPKADESQRTDEAGKDVMRVLFIGNSLTYANDLPLVVQALAKAQGRNMLVESVTFGGASLDDHWYSGEALRMLKSKKWDVVIMQQGPSSLSDSQAHLREWAAKWAGEITKNGGRPALYMVWPGLDRYGFFDAVRESYSNAASDANGIFLPAGEALRAAAKMDPSARLYSSDGFHPSVAGTYAAALSIYGVLYKKDPTNLPARLTLADGQVVEIPQDLAKLLQDAATGANRQYGRP